MTTSLKNPHINAMKSDYLYHINVRIPDTTNTTDLQQQFGDIKIVCLGGTKCRMLKVAEYLLKYVQIEHKGEIIDIAASGHRYAIFKVGPVLCCSHGVGMSSMSVLLHELFKLLIYAKCVDPIFLRIGTSGGIGITPGTIVITRDAFNGYLRKEYEIAILGKRIVRPSQFNETVYKDLMACTETLDNFNVILGNTLACECFYEGQGRLDGASCNYTKEEKIVFLERCQALGIINIEMEATMFASLTHHIGIKAGELCVTLVNRLQGDQITCSNEEMEIFVQRLFVVLSRYIKKILAN